MNETEKKVFNSLSEEEQNKVAGGGRISSDDELTEKQCKRLKSAANHEQISPTTATARDLLRLHPEVYLRIAYGCKKPPRPTKDDAIKFLIDNSQIDTKCPSEKPATPDKS